MNYPMNLTRKALKMQNEDYYGAPTNTSVKPLRERLRELYEPEEFVTVINVDTKPVKYQFMAPQDTETYSDYPGHKNTIMKRPPQVVTLQPGETKLCPAYEADLMIEATVKQIALRRVEDKVASGELDRQKATADWTDPYFQVEMIKQIFVGKKDILNAYNNPTPVAEVEKDLDFNEQAKVGRPRKEV
jgi:hypothetical protein